MCLPKPSYFVLSTHILTGASSASLVEENQSGVYMDGWTYSNLERREYMVHHSSQASFYSQVYSNLHYTIEEVIIRLAKRQIRTSHEQTLKLAYP